MIDFTNFKPDGQSPIYLQILTFIKQGAVAGTIENGDPLPSRRNLSALLGINPNTVQKAFSMLEEEGLVESRTGTKSVMVLDEEKIRRLRRELISESVKTLTAAMHQMDISKEEALALIEKYWEEE